MEKKTNRIGRKRQIDYGEKDDRGINIFKVYRRFILIKQKINNLLTIPSLTVAKESRAHKRRNYAIYELLLSF